MLLLSRRTGETIQIGDDITVTVLSVKGNQVRIGISAPEGVKILREELIDKQDRADAQIDQGRLCIDLA